MKKTFRDFWSPGRKGLRISAGMGTIRGGFPTGFGWKGEKTRLNSNYGERYRPAQLEGERKYVPNT